MFWQIGSPRTAKSRFYCWKPVAVVGVSLSICPVHSRFPWRQKNLIGAFLASPSPVLTVAQWTPLAVAVWADHLQSMAWSMFVDTPVILMSGRCWELRVGTTPAACPIFSVRRRGCTVGTIIGEATARSEPVTAITEKIRFIRLSSMPARKLGTVSPTTTMVSARKGLDQCI